MEVIYTVIYRLTVNGIKQSFFTLTVERVLESRGAVHELRMRVDGPLSRNSRG